MLTPYTRPELLDLIALNWTDPLNGQNTAARARQIAEALVASSLNLLEDGVSSGSADLTALLAKIASNQDKAAPVASDAYGPGIPDQPLATVLDQLAWLFTHLGATAPTAYSIATARDARDAGALTVGAVSINGPWSGQGDSTVFTQALGPSLLSPVGVWQQQDGSLSWCDIDLDTGTATPRLGTRFGRVVNQSQALALAAANGLQAGTYIVADYWNMVAGGVLLTPINVGAFASIGYIYIGGKAIAVVADLAALTFELLDDYIRRLAGSTSGGVAEALHLLYSVQASDVTTPARPLTIPVPGATSFGVVGVEKAGSQGPDLLTPGSMYTVANEQVTISTSLSPPLAVGDQVIIYYNTGSVSGGYTDVQARAAQLNRVASPSTTSITLLAESFTDYGTAATGTFTVDATGAVPGKVVLFRVGPGGGAPGFVNAPADKPYNLSAAGFVAGKINSYSVAVLSDEIEVINLPR